ncbi:hypothetical protein [Nitrosomonas ureae]|uniref:hypothetical protein n=1 Tax=Nitrosomonas ureae TaxID=44577 RepID=UPI000CDF09A1|nr:hypothetical protein [Nitrosomonas ureae]
MTMSFSEYDVTRRTRKGNFLKQIDQLIDWNSIEKAITVHYAPVLDATGRPAYSGFAAVQDAVGRNLERRFKR